MRFDMILHPHKISAILTLRNMLIMFLTFLPGNTGAKWRSWYYRKKFKKCGKNLRIGKGVIIEGAENITVGDNVHIDRYCVIEAGKIKLTQCKKIVSQTIADVPEGELIIGNNIHIVSFSMLIAEGGIMISDNCTLSAGSKIYSITNLAYDPDNRTKRISIMPYEQAPFLISPVVLEQNVWIGLHGIVMPGVRIGRDSFVVSNSLVMHSFPENSYIAGQPAKRIRERFLTEHAQA